MTLPLWSIEQAPRTLPIWQAILEDLSHPPAKRVARVLGTGVRTVHRWNATGRAPRAAQLALFWLTRWGRSSVHAQATNDAIVACGLVSGLRARVSQLEGERAHLLALGGSGAANDPLLGAPR